MYYTHLAFGLLVSLLSLTLFNIQNKILFIIVVIFFALFPDIDETHSKLGRKYKITSKLINFFFGHRGFIHSIYIPLILYIIFNYINHEISIAILVGYFSHLFLDALTPKGIKPFYPLFNKRISGFLKTNSFFGEDQFFNVSFFEFIFDFVVVINSLSVKNPFIKFGRDFSTPCAAATIGLGVFYLSPRHIFFNIENNILKPCPSRLCARQKYENLIYGYC